MCGEDKGSMDHSQILSRLLGCSTPSGDNQRSGSSCLLGDSCSPKQPEVTAVVLSTCPLQRAGTGAHWAGICSQDLWEFLAKRAVQPPLLITLSSVQAEGRTGAGKKWGER